MWGIAHSFNAIFRDFGLVDSFPLCIGPDSLHRAVFVSEARVVSSRTIMCHCMCVDNDLEYLMRLLGLLLCGIIVVRYLISATAMLSRPIVVTRIV